MAGDYRYRHPTTSDDDTTKGTDFERYGKLRLEGSENLGVTLNAGELTKQIMEEVGYVDVVEVVYKWPLNKWPTDIKMKELGKHLSSLLLFPHYFSFYKITRNT